MKKLLLSAIILLIFLLSGCNHFSAIEARRASENYLLLLSNNDWDLIWENSSVSYKKSMNDGKMLKLRHWVNRELGTLVDYKQTYFYLGSKFGLKDNYFVTSCYLADFEKGYGEIKFNLIKEEGGYKILNIEFAKKPKL